MRELLVGVKAQILSADSVRLFDHLCCDVYALQKGLHVPHFPTLQETLRRPN